MKIITLTTDFGLDDPFAGIMKGVILSIIQDRKGEIPQLIDLTHQVPFGAVETAGFHLKTAYKYFPPGTIHLAVVDPGVGGQRQALAVEAGGQYFIAPDNGLLSPIFHLYPRYDAYLLENRDYMLEDVSSTFHGRDIFAPAAAYLVSGVPIESFGRKIKHPVISPEFKFEITGDSAEFHIIHIDYFGNLFTNIPGEYASLLLKRSFLLTIGKAEISQLCYAYEMIPEGEAGLISGSSGQIEIAFKNASAAEKLKIAIRDRGQIEFL
ncbi:SAM-dependent chlorinase/fluorinase [bacterium]|nr:SAM-dependent chlorinase/fluorinase [bacterium]